MAGPADGASGLSQIRFLDLKNGWAYGPQLYATHTAGKTWAQVDTGGLRVTALETVGDRVFAVWASCTGDGPAYAVNCTRFTLYSASAYGRDLGAGGRLDHRADQRSGQRGRPAGAHRQPRLPARAGRGAVLGPVDGSGPWTRVSSLVASCPVGPARGNGQPTGALLGAVNTSDLLLACVSASSGTSPSVSTQQKFVYSSKNGGSELGADDHGPSRRGGLRAGRQPDGERDARHRPGHRPAARG